MPQTDWGWLIEPAELASWIISNDDRFLVVNKPGFVVCHPSKHGPWSSLIGACREYLGVERLHMPSRLDRETSGAMVFVKDQSLASQLQRAAQHRRVHKRYFAVLTGALREPLTVDQPIGRALNSRVIVKRGIVEGGQQARTLFEPISTTGGYTLARVTPLTGRLHQIRVHAAWMGHPIAADKLYGADETLFLEFIERGFTERLADALPLSRHALHATSIEFETGAGAFRFEAPLPEDLRRFCIERQLKLPGD